MNLHENLYRPSLNYIKKERFTGSDTGMRFMFEMKKEDEKDKGVILACVWSEPFSYEKTEEDNKEYKEFPFTDDGLHEAISWVESRHEKYERR